MGGGGQEPEGREDQDDSFMIFSLQLFLQPKGRRLLGTISTSAVRGLFQLVGMVGDLRRSGRDST